MSFYFILFFVIYAAIYGLLNYYFYKRIKVFVEGKKSLQSSIKLFQTIMFLAPFMVNLMARTENYTTASLFAYTGYIWMIVVFFFFLVNLIIEIFIKEILKSNLNQKVTCILTIFTVSFLISYGIFENRNISTEYIELTSTKIPVNIEKVRIIQLSDIHFSSTTGVPFAKKVISLVNQLEPDIIVFTGDFLDPGISDENKIVQLFSNMYAPLGKYAVTGNHEFYTGYKKAIDFVEKCGFKMIRNDNVIINNFLNIVGVDDKSIVRINGKIPNDLKILSRKKDDLYTIFLKHQPTVSDDIKTKFDLMLSGHTHNGQFFPWSLVTTLLFKYHAGLYQLTDNSYIYVTRGVGTWGPPIRILAPPEISIIDIFPESVK